MSIVRDIQSYHVMRRTACEVQCLYACAGCDNPVSFGMGATYRQVRDNDVLVGLELVCRNCKDASR